MDTNERETAVNPEEEFKKLREKTGREELSELKHGLLGGYKKKDVAAYVDRLKDQLATTERTYKAHIADLSAEKDQLRYEVAALQSKLKHQESQPVPLELQSALQQAKSAAEGFQAERGTLEEQLKYVTRMSDETIATLQDRVDALSAELRAAEGRNEALRYEHEAAIEEQREQHDKALAAASTEREGLQVQLEALAAKAGRMEAGLRCELNEMTSRMEAGQARAAEAELKVEEAARQLEVMWQENAALTAQVETARQNITALLQDKEAVEAINGQLRKALNSLVVKAEAVVKENNVVNGLLDTERDRVQQYQALNGRLSDMLARVRMAGQLLDERVTDLDKALLRDDLQQNRPAQGAPKRMKADPLDLSAKGNPLKDIVAELNAIQANLAQYQQPGRPDDPEKKPNIRYSVEKLEVDCQPAKAESSWEEIGDFIKPAARLRDTLAEETDLTIN